MDYPKLKLEKSILVQPEVKTAEVTVNTVTEDLSAMTVVAHINVGPAVYWVPVMDAATYKADWSDKDVAEAVKAFLKAL